MGLGVLVRVWWVARAYGHRTALLAQLWDGSFGAGLARCVWWGRRWVSVGARPLLENCTVDASIFVVKLVRAHGGCLGTRSR